MTELLASLEPFNRRETQMNTERLARRYQPPECKICVYLCAYVFETSQYTSRR
jgi:hypothetical protein